MWVCFGKGNGNPLQYSCLKNPMDRGALWAIVHSGSVWVHLIWDLLYFLHLNIYFLLEVWEFFSHYFFKYIFDPLLSLLSFWHLYFSCFILSHKSRMLLSFVFICLSVCCSDWVISIILFSRSLTCSSVLLSLVFTASRLVFISAMELSNFDWFLFIVSSFLLEWSAFLLKIFISFSIFITSFLSSLSCRLVRSVSLFTLLWDFSCSFNWEWFLWFFILLHFLCLYNFRRKWSIMVLERVFFSGSTSVKTVWARYFGYRSFLSMCWLFPTWCVMLSCSVMFDFLRPQGL